MHCVCNNRLAFAMGMWVAVLGGTMMFIFANRFIPPYSHEGNFQQVTCTVQSVVSSGNYCCDATWRGMASCASIIPCYQIAVNYMLPGGSTNVSAYLYGDYRSYTYQQPNYNCSIYRCPSTFAETKTEGDNLVSSKGQVGQSYACYRNPNVPTEVLPHQTSLATVIISILLSAAALIIGLAIGIPGYKGTFKYCQAEWEEEDEDDDEKGLFEKKSADGSESDLHKGVENGEVAQTDEGATDDTHVECMSLSSQSKLKEKNGTTTEEIPDPPAYNSVA